jgi:acetylornithine/succinyldiaminopimelate/putrescine aminotransferase
MDRTLLHSWLNPFRAKQGEFPTYSTLFELIHGIYRIVIPPAGYLSKVRELCTKHNVLLICDEIQTVSRSDNIPVLGLMTL